LSMFLERNPSEEENLKLGMGRLSQRPQ